MSSYAYGKGEVCDWVRVRFPTGATVLDVGACDGNWRRLLPVSGLQRCRRAAQRPAAAGPYRSVGIRLRNKRQFY